MLCSQNEGGRSYIQSKHVIVQTFPVIPTADVLVIAGVAFGDFFLQRMFSNRYDLKIEILLLFPKSNQNKSIFIVLVPKYTESLYAES